MKLLIQWLCTLSAGLFVGTQTMRLFKVANEENESYFAHITDSSAIRPDDSDLPYIMGSEQISAALQRILSSDKNNLESRLAISNDMFIGTSQKDCTLGSESLNRMLEEMMSNSEQINFEPAIQI